MPVEHLLDALQNANGALIDGSQNKSNSFNLALQQKYWLKAPNTILERLGIAGGDQRVSCSGPSPPRGQISKVS